MLALYVVAQFFFNWGPNTTTFVVPGECFPTRYRSTGHDLSAAMGKVGAILAQVISIPLLTKDAPDVCSGSDCSPWLDRLMQIYALFMLCGTAVSLLIPETKGITLEELAGESPTSYNAGRNGSITKPPRRRWWNPFAGGQPAGFFYPKVGGGGGGFAAGRSPRVGIMTSPELLAAASAEEKGKKGLTGSASNHHHHRRWGAAKKSRESNDYPPSTSSTAPIDDLGPPAMPAAVLPGWGAGWGRIDRGGHPTSLENIRLQDVGSLLK